MDTEPSAFLNRHETYEELQRRAQARTDELTVALEQLRTETTLRQQAEARLAETERLHRAWIETSQRLIWSTDAQDRWTFVSATAREFFDCEPAEMIGRPFADFFSPERAANDSRFLEDVKKGIPRFYYDTIHVRENGSEVWLRFNAIPFMDSEGTFIAALGTAADISSTQTGESRFRRLLEAAPDAMIIVGNGGDIVLVNEQTERLFGYHRNELLGKSVEMLVPETLRQHHEELRKQFFRKPAHRPMGPGLELHGRRKSGELFPIEISLSPLETGDDMLVTAAIRDVSLRKEYEVALLKKEQQLRLVTDAFPVLIAYVNADLRYEFNNAGYQSWFGIPPEAFQGELIRDMIGEEAFELLKDDYALALSGQRVDFEVRIPYKYGGARLVRSTLIPHFDELSGVVGFFVLTTDITDLKKAEEVARRTERLASVGTLAAGIAHEINNPICAARTAAEVAIACRDKPNASSIFQECLVTILDSVKRCDQIVKNVLRIARDVPSEKTPQDINEIIRNANLMADKYFVLQGVGVCLQLCATPLIAPVNRLDIELVLINLIQNAVAASDHGKIVAIHTSCGSNVAQIAIQDQGCGMSEQQIERIFDPFYTNRRDGSGTGLGLCLVDNIVREHEGTIKVESKVGIGSTFTVELPLST